MRTQATASLSRLEEGIPFARRHDSAVRERLSGPGLRTFFNIASEWGLSVNQQRVLLGGVPPSTYHKWKGGTVGTLSYDQLERISLTLGIYKALKLLFADDASGVAPALGPWGVPSASWEWRKTVKFANLALNSPGCAGTVVRPIEVPAR